MRLFFFLLIVLAHPVFAETYTISSSSVDLCAGYQPSQSIDYQPADDVNLNSYDFGFKDKILEIPVELETLQALGVSPAIMNIYNLEPALGVLELHPNGSLHYKGQQIGTTSLEDACEKRGGAPLMGNEKEFIEGDSSYE